MSKLIVIIGITGNQGSSVAETFLKHSEWKIRGITRDPSKPNAQALTVKGVEVVKADIEDKASLIQAFTGAHAIFAVTDFWAFVRDPEAAKAAGKRINEYAYDREVQQGQNIADAAADPAVLKTLQRFVYSSLSNVRKWSRGKYTLVYHFDSKAQVVEYIKNRHPDLNARTSTVQIGEYADNWRNPALAPHKQPDGSFLIAKPHPGDSPIPMVVTQKDTGSFVWALVHSPPGTHLLGYGSLIGWEEYTQIWGRILNVRAEFKQISPEEYLNDLKGALPDDLAREISEGHQYHGEFGWDGGDPNIKHPKDLEIDVPTTSIEEYIRSEDWSSLLQS